jgi:DNA invertase Pin-like site-specific DNA recombinase
MMRGASGPLRCVLYARFSSENQREASLEDQLRVCRVRAEREGWQVVASFTDAAISGSTALRPGYQALLALLRAGGADVVLSESLDRFSRDQEHVAGFDKQAAFAGVRVVTLAEGEISELGFPRFCGHGYAADAAGWNASAFCSGVRYPSAECKGPRL